MPAASELATLTALAQALSRPASLADTLDAALATVADALLTGLHEPSSSHLSLLEALAGREHVARAYRAAGEGGYLWHEFGDLHLILPDRRP